MQLFRTFDLFLSHHQRKCLNSSYRNIKIEITCGYVEQHFRHTARESTVQIVCLLISVEFDIT